MAKLVSCVPNFSEGRRPEIIDAIVKEITSVQGVKLLDVNPDASHNRVVVSFIGSPTAVKEAAFKSCAKATELIDMEKHSGEHPRMGATDVIPFIPVKEVTMEECIELARSLGEEIAKKLNIPVFLYEEAAKIPTRTTLPSVRKGQYEGLKEDIKKPERHPDYGPAAMHPSAGAVAVGARQHLVAYNINLDTAGCKYRQKDCQFHPRSQRRL